jgi:hypothetical protein
MKAVKLIGRLYYLIYFIINNIRRSINYRWAVYRADNDYKLTGKQVWVLQSDSVHYVLFTNDTIKHTNKYLKTHENYKQLNIIELNKIAAYKTGTSTLNKRTLKNKLQKTCN